jgi:hypothetical protein
MEGYHNMRLEITPELVIYIYREAETVPFFQQPYYPDQTPWLDRSDCEEWGQGYLNWITDSSIYPEPPLSPLGWPGYRALLPQE